MIDEEKQEQKELEVKLDEVNEDTEVEIPANPLDTLTERVENGELDDKLEEEEEKPQTETKKAPEYSDDMPYSLKVRKRIAKEVAKRAEAEQRIAELEEKLEETQRKTFDIASKSLSNQLKSVSVSLKQAIEEGDTDKQVKLYENMADIRNQLSKTEEYGADLPKKEAKKERKAPPLAAEWVKSNSTWFNKPGYRKETAMAYGIDAELTEEGWDVNDPGYYDEMDKRLKQTSLPYFSKKSEEDTSNSEKNVVQRTNRVQSPVAGVSRKKATDSNRVKLTSDDLATAKTFGIDINDEAALKRFAKEVKSFSTNT
jgi:hypothetical protein